MERVVEHVKNKHLLMLGIIMIIKLNTNTSKFHPAGHGSETQLQVDENLNFIMLGFKSQSVARTETVKYVHALESAYRLNPKPITHLT